MLSLPLKIKAFRERLRMSQGEFAQKIGVNQQNIAYNEQETTASGKERTVSFDLIDKICAAFGIEKDTFINGSVDEIVNSTKSFCELIIKPETTQTQRPNDPLVLSKPITLEDYIDLRVRFAQAEQLARDMLSQNNLLLQQNGELVRVLDNRLHSQNKPPGEPKENIGPAVQMGGG